MNYLLILFVSLSFGFTFEPAFAQSPIIINQTTPCFLQENITKIQMLKDCGLEEDFLDTFLLPWEWATGGYFSMFLVIVLIFITYMKYGKAIYPLIVGTLYLPMSIWLFPEQFTSYGLIFIGVLAGIWIWFIFVRQTKDYSS